MSSWSMNDGSALTGAYTFTNGSAIIQGNSSADTSEIQVGDIVIDDNGDKVRVADIQPARTVATSAVNASNEQITITNHGFIANQEVHYKANGGTAIAGLTDETTFFVKAVASANAFTLSATEGGAVIDITGTGNNAQTISGTSTKAFTATNTFTPSTNSGSSCTVTRPPIDGSGKTTTSAGTTTAVIDDNVLGITATEAVAGVDNVTGIAVATAGTGYASAPSVSVAAPTARTVATAKVSTSDNTITVDAGHNMRTGTKLTYTSNGTNLEIASSAVSDSTALFVINTGSTTTFKLATSLSNAQAGTAANITGAGNNSQTFQGDTATATATVSSGKVTGFTVTAVGSDYQSVPAVTVAAPAEKTFNAQSAVSTANDTITINSHGFATGDQITYSDKGGTTLANLTDNGTLFVIRTSANAFKVATSLSNASSGTNIDLTAGSSENHGVTGVTATATASQGLGTDGDNNNSEVAHIGWVKKTVGTGGRAGRVHYETLVAASSISGDAEDILTPDS